MFTARDNYHYVSKCSSRARAHANLRQEAVANYNVATTLSHNMRSGRLNSCVGYDGRGPKYAVTSTVVSVTRWVVYRRESSVGRYSAWEAAEPGPVKGDQDTPAGKPLLSTAPSETGAVSASVVVTARGNRR